MASGRFRPSDKGGGEGEGGHPDPERGAPPLDSPLIPTLKTRRLNSFFFCNSYCQMDAYDEN